jgi:uncharacterized protein YndB with AHSA1/START domain
MRVQQTFTIGRPPEVVFDYVSDPSKLAEWQTANRSVEQLTPGQPGRGARFRERTKPPGAREFEQITEFAEYERPRRLRVHVVDGPQPIDGEWIFTASEGATIVTFTAEGELHGWMRFLGPVVRALLARNFAAYHRNLRANLESG